MNDQILAAIDFVLKLLETIPGIGHYISLISGLAIGLSALCSAVVVFWHGLAALVKALGILTSIKAIEDFGDMLCVDEAKINSFEQSWIIPILNRLSILSLPKAARPLNIHTQGDV